MAIKFHRCTGQFIKGPHPCWQVQKALDERGVPYEIVAHPAFPRSRRTEYKELTGQAKLPALELEDGTIVRGESKDVAARVRAGEFG